MTITQNINTCFQCGKERVVVRVYKEHINGSLVTTTQSVCSDDDCQKRTVNKLERERVMRQGLMEDRVRSGRYRSNPASVKSG